MLEPTDSALQHAIATAVAELVSSGTETGIQVAVVRDGRLVADVAAGLADPGTGRMVRPDTLFYAASAAKGVASSVAHVLAERGLLDYDLRLAEAWPEFGAHGKDRVTVRHVLLHTAGVPGLPPDTTVADLCDWDRMCAVIAASEPWWEPGTRFGYHSRTFGFVLGETIRRVTGRTISEHLRDLITGPLSIQEEVMFGVPEPLLRRVARQVAPAGPPPAAPPAGSPLAKAEPPGITTGAVYANRPDVLRAEIVSEGTMTARGAARLYSALIRPAAGVRLVGPRRLAAMAAIAVSGQDQVMGFPASWAFGYSPGRPGGVPSRPGSTFGMVGGNGCAAYADIDAGIAVAVMRNQFTAGDLTTVMRIDRLIAQTPG